MKQKALLILGPALVGLGMTLAPSDSQGLALVGTLALLAGLVSLGGYVILRHGKR